MRESLRGWWSPLLAGLTMGSFGVVLALLGNPRNSGICVSCFLENAAGALGLHGDTRMMYLRPELAGFLLGAFAMALGRRDFRVRGGSSPLVRFFLGFFIITGCAVFIGCPIKLAQRLAAGDLTAPAGAAGLAVGVYIGVLFLRGGFTLGRAEERTTGAGYLMPGVMLLLLLGLYLQPAFIGRSLTGPGAMHPAWYWSLGAALVLGGIAQHSRFCITGSVRNIFLARDPAFAAALGMLLASSFILALIFGQFRPGLLDQPGAHPDHLWNFLGMALVGFAAVLADGCPFRQLILSGEGDLDAGVTLAGMLIGAALCYDWYLRSTTAGPTFNGRMAVLMGLIFCFLVANTFRKRV